MNTAVLSILPTGQVNCFYTELIDLTVIGPLQITRATTIEYNHQTQQWEVKDTSQKLLFSHASRKECLEWESNTFNPLT